MCCAERRGRRRNSCRCQKVGKGGGVLVAARNLTVLFDLADDCCSCRCCIGFRAAARCAVSLLLSDTKVCVLSSRSSLCPSVVACFVCPMYDKAPAKKLPFVLIYTDSTAAFEWVGIATSAQLHQKHQSDVDCGEMLLRLNEWKTVCPFCCRLPAASSISLARACLFRRKRKPPRLLPRRLQMGSLLSQSCPAIRLPRLRAALRRGSGTLLFFRCCCS
jgi:hypothetical protein